MPEGPALVILREAVKSTGKRILRTEANSKIDKDRLIGKRITTFRSWGVSDPVSLTCVISHILGLYLRNNSSWMSKGMRPK
jgi:hypothetical protein